MLVKKLKQSGTLIKPPQSKQIKTGLVILAPGEDVGWHITKNREEIIVVLKGRGTVECQGQRKNINQGDFIYIEAEKEHNVFNTGKEELHYLYLVSLF